MKRGLLLLAVAVLLVALGVVLGAGPLQLSQSHTERDLVRERATTTALQRETETQRAEVGFADAYARASASALLNGALADRAVAVLVLPGADPETVTGLRADVATAGGRVAGVVELSAKAVSAAGRQLVEALTSQMATQTPQLSVPADAGGFERLGALLGRAIGATPDETGPAAGAAYDAPAVAIVAGLETAEVVKVTEPVSARAGVVLVVGGPPAHGADASAENAVPLTILRSLAGQTPVVVSGSAAAAGPGGLIGAIRADSGLAGVLATTDGVQTAMGQVVAVRALAARGSGTIGHYGGADAPDGALPPS